MLVKTIVAAGAEVSWSGCNPLSTQDDVAAALAADGISIYAWHGQSRDEFYWSIDRTLEIQADPHARRRRRPDLPGPQRAHRPRPGVIGGTEETTTGVHRLRAMAAAGKLLYPVIAVNDAQTKWDFDNVLRHGPVHHRRDPARHLDPPRGQDLRRGRLRPLRPGRRPARARHGLDRGRVRGRPRRRPARLDGRVRRDAHGRGRGRSATSSSPPRA